MKITISHILRLNRETEGHVLYYIFYSQWDATKILFFKKRVIMKMYIYIYTQKIVS